MIPFRVERCSEYSTPWAEERSPFDPSLDRRLRLYITLINEPADPNFPPEDEIILADSKLTCAAGKLTWAERFPDLPDLTTLFYYKDAVWGLTAAFFAQNGYIIHLKPHTAKNEHSR